MSAASLRVAVRVDASARIGLGHLQRCIALAQALRRAGAQVLFVARDLGVDCNGAVARAGFALRRLPRPEMPAVHDAQPAHAAWAEVDWLADAEQTVAAGSAHAPDWVLVDHYAFDARWHEHIARALGARIAVVDDLADRPLAANLLIEHNLAADHRVKYAGRLGASARLLGGPRYALLGPAYADAARHEPRDDVHSIGIFMGGVDAARLCEAALEGCRAYAGFRGPIEIVATSAHPHLDALRTRVAGDAAATLSLDLPDLAAFFARHDLQIGAGGGAAWERCCIGAPTLALVAADNQRTVADGLRSAGAAAALPVDAAATPARIGAAVRDLLHDAPRRRQLGERARTLVDGRGAERVALVMAAPTLYLRPATQDDAVTMHRWRDHPLTRAMSHDAAPIDFAAHLGWLTRALADRQRRLFVAAVGSIDVGVIRFDAADDASQTVSLYLDPDLHGLGLGPAMLRAGEARLQADGVAVRRFVAEVLERNRGSQRLFADAGYRPVDGRWEKPAGADATQELHEC
jgi:UDP-2,4-diacetamido-2,4,6-trideoxy-beta-L-altropyranose hydrolase